MFALNLRPASDSLLGSIQHQKHLNENNGFYRMRPQRACSYLLPSLMRAHLRLPFQRFLLTARPPLDLRCLLLVSRNLLSIFNAPTANPPGWFGMDPFQQWPELFQHIIDRKDEISDRIGPQVAFGMNATHSGKSKANSDPMKGKIRGGVRADCEGMAGRRS